MIHDASVQFRFFVVAATSDADRETIREALKTKIQGDIPKLVRDAWSHFSLALSGTEAQKRTQWEAALDQFVAEWNAATGGGNHAYDKNSIEATYWVDGSKIVCQHHYTVDPSGAPTEWSVVVATGGGNVTVKIRLAMTIRTPCT